METPERQSEEPEDFEFGDDWFEDEIIDPEDIPLPLRDREETDDYLERKQKKLRQQKRRREKYDKHREGWEEKP